MLHHMNWSLRDCHAGINTAPFHKRKLVVDKSGQLLEITRKIQQS